MFLHFVHSNSNRSLTQSGTGRPSPVTPRTSPCTLCTSRLSSVMSTLVSRVAVQANISQYLLPHCECNCPRLWMTSKLSCYNDCSQCWQSILPQCERHCPRWPWITSLYTYLIWTFMLCPCVNRGPCWNSALLQHAEHGTFLRSHNLNRLYFIMQIVLWRDVVLITIHFYFTLYFTHKTHFFDLGQWRSHCSAVVLASIC